MSLKTMKQWDKRIKPRQEAKSTKSQEVAKPQEIVEPHHLSVRDLRQWLEGTVQSDKIYIVDERGHRVPFTTDMVFCADGHGEDFCLTFALAHEFYRENRKP